MDPIVAKEATQVFAIGLFTMAIWAYLAWQAHSLTRKHAILVFLAFSAGWLCMLPFVMVCMLHLEGVTVMIGVIGIFCAYSLLASFCFNRICKWREHKKDSAGGDTSCGSVINPQPDKEY